MVQSNALAQSTPNLAASTLHRSVQSGQSAEELKRQAEQAQEKELST